MKKLNLDDLVRAAEVHCLTILGDHLVCGAEDINLWLRVATEEQKLAVVHEYLMETC